MLKGWKTIVFGLLLAVGPQMLDFLANVNWASVGISPNVASLIGVAIIGLRAVTSTPVGRTGAMLAALVLPLALGACTGGAQQTGIDIAQDAGAGIVRNLSASDLASLRSTCLAAAPAIYAAATSPAPPAVQDIAVYPYTFCKQLIAGSLGNANQTSLTWLPKVLAGVQDAADIANVLLPVALKALPLVMTIL